jgi:hypothetical protein
LRLALISFVMPNSLRNRLSELATGFAASVLDAIRGASLDELLMESSGAPGRGAARSASRATAGGPRRRGGRLPRRSAGDIAEVIEHIVGLLKQRPTGLRAEQIREELGLQAKELPRPLKDALDAGLLGKSGQKRATTYFVKGAGGGKGGRSASAGGRRARGAGARKTGARRAKRGRAAEKKETTTTTSVPQET